MTTPTTPDPPFERTVCSCQDCRTGCLEQPGSLADGELERIAAHLQLPVRVAALRFWASPGALLLSAATGRTYRLGTITPRLVRGRCTFLAPDDTCRIHAVAPYGCRMFDTHMPASEAQPRSQWLVRSQASPAYQSLRKTLAPAASYHPRSY